MLFVCLMSVQCDFSLSTQVPILNHSALSQFTARNLICWGCSQCILLGCCVDMKRYTNSIFYCTVKGTLVCVNTSPPPDLFSVYHLAQTSAISMYITFIFKMHAYRNQLQACLHWICRPVTQGNSDFAGVTERTPFMAL